MSRLTPDVCVMEENSSKASNKNTPVTTSTDKKDNNTSDNNNRDSSSINSDDSERKVAKYYDDLVNLAEADKSYADILEVCAMEELLRFRIIPMTVSGPSEGYRLRRDGSDKDWPVWLVMYYKMQPTASTKLNHYGVLWGKSWCKQP